MATDPLGVGVRVNTCGTVLCEPAWSWHPRPKSGGDFDLWFVWAGRGTMRFDDRSVDLGPGDCFCLRPWLGYDATQDPAHRLGVCYIHFDFVRAGRPFRPPRDAVPAHHARLPDVDLHERMLRQAVSLVHTGTSPARAQAAALVQATLLAMRTAAEAPASTQAGRAHEERIRAAMRAVHEQPGRMVTVEEMAECAGYSVDHFTRLFRSVAGVTPKEFCIRARLERACLLLRESRMTVEQVAENLGYADVFFFSRQFKQRLGVPPTQWRRRDATAADESPGRAPRNG